MVVQSFIDLGFSPDSNPTTGRLLASDFEGFMILSVVPIDESLDDSYRYRLGDQHVLT